MSSRGWVIRAVLGGLGWAWLGLGLTQAGSILPTDPATGKLSAGSPVTVSLYQLDSDLPSAATLTLKSPSRCTTTGTGLYKDVTDCWLPEWHPGSGGQEVYVVINGSGGSPMLVLPTQTLTPGTETNPFLGDLTTSAYPGKCTNLGLVTDADYAGADFRLDLTPVSLTTPAGLVTGYKLTPNDCGGMAVIQVGSLKFIVPGDGTTTAPDDGIPEIWANLHGGNLDPLDPADDIDTGPMASSPQGDGLSTFDEYRGFIVSGKQVRTDPKQKDLLLHVVNPADSVIVGGPFVTSTSCGTSCYGGGTTTYPAPTAPSATLTVPATAGTPGAIATFTTSTGVFSNAHVRGEIIGNVSGRARIVSVTAPTSATAEITQAFPTTSLSPGAWQVSESLFALVYTLLAPERVHLVGYAPGATNPITTNEWVDTFVSLIPAQTLSISDSVTDRIVNVNRLYGPAQKGVRIMEALNTNSSSVLGWSYGVASPNQAGNVTVFTQRIINSIDSLIVGATALRYSTASLVNGVWTWTTPISVNRNFILSKAFQFYTGHEIHHSLKLTPGVQGTNKTTYGHHFAPGTGDCLDQAITTTSKSGTVTFYIPSLCGTADQTQFVLQ